MNDDEKNQYQKTEKAESENKKQQMKLKFA
jgi:hypothetical protein